MTRITRRSALVIGIGALLASAGLHAPSPQAISLPAGECARKGPAELGMDAAALADAVD